MPDRCNFELFALRQQCSLDKGHEGEHKTIHEVGRTVYCNACELRKKPVGRSAAPEQANSLCDSSCNGYDNTPHVGSLWPGETRSWRERPEVG
ncbi:MAG: hypothetical protein V3W41_21855 [Planctomycetota bacterium]